MMPVQVIARYVVSLAGFGLVLSLGRGSLSTGAMPGDKAGPGLRSINQTQIEEHVAFLAAPGMEGRDTPSEGQTRAARYLANFYAEHGLEYASDSLMVMKEAGGTGPDHDATEGSFLRPFLLDKTAPTIADCYLAFETPDDESVDLTYGEDFVPILRANGEAEGPLVFGGFGIDSSKHKYNDFKSIKVRGAIVLLFSGEPRHKKKFEGPEDTLSASLFDKLATLNKLEAAGALVVRRDPVNAPPDPENGLDFRYTNAWFAGQGSRVPRQPSTSLPTLTISMDCASRLLGQDARKLALSMDKAAKPKKIKLKGMRVKMGASTERQSVRHDNLVGILRGTDPELSEEYVVIGAHYDHIGVGPGGRVACGANDNASGCAAFLEVLQALSSDPPRRSILFANFCGEEDSLQGSRNLAKDLPIPLESVVCMVNLDMIGFGDSKGVAVLGTIQNPKLETVLSRAKRIKGTGMKTVVTGKGKELWERSDHYSFHSEGLPVLFFFEGLPLSDDKDYHTWRDTADKLNYPKVTTTARMVYNTVWILANDTKRPPVPRD